MAITGTVHARCPGCDRGQDCALVQSIDARAEPAVKARLLAGELNVLACACGRTSQLQATVLYRDPDAGWFCQVCPGGDRAMAEGEAAFRAAGVSGTLRLVPSLNALIEKLRILDAGLVDWAIEMTKVLLLSTLAADAGGPGARNCAVLVSDMGFMPGMYVLMGLVPRNCPGAVPGTYGATGARRLSAARSATICAPMSWPRFAPGEKPKERSVKPFEMTPPNTSSCFVRS